jgi:hypothetical protein
VTNCKTLLLCYFQVRFQLWDVGSTCRYRSPNVLSLIGTDCDALVGVVDSSRIESVKEFDAWFGLLALYICECVPRTICVHKADLPNKCLDHTAMEIFVKNWSDKGISLDWCWTVGHPR